MMNRTNCGKVILRPEHISTLVLEDSGVVMESVSADGQFVLQSVMTVASVPSTPTAVQCDNA